MPLQTRLEKYAGDELQTIYHDINSHLVERRILPDVRAGVPRASMPQPPKRGAKPAPRPPSHAAAAAQHANAPIPEGDILAALAQLLNPPSAPASQQQGYGGAAQPAAGGVIPSWPTAPGAAAGGGARPPGPVFGVGPPRPRVRPPRCG